MYWGSTFKTTEEFLDSFQKKREKDLKTYLLKVVEKPNFQKIIQILYDIHGRVFIKKLLWEEGEKK